MIEIKVVYSTLLYAAIHSKFDLFRGYSLVLCRYRHNEGKCASLTRREIANARTNHRRRLQYLRDQLGYPDDHPMVSWHRRQLKILDSREVLSGVGGGIPERSEDMLTQGEAP